MSPEYNRLTLIERIRIADMLSCRASQARIAEHLGYSPSAISQEISKNSDYFGYNAHVAEISSRFRRPKRKKPVLRNKQILDFVTTQLKEFKRSPAQISIMAKLQGLIVSKSSIYTFINQNPKYKKYLRHKKRKRKNTNQTIIQNRVSIFDRPLEAQSRSEFGHFEIDFLFASKTPILVAIDRKTRYSKLKKQKSRSSAETELNIAFNLVPLKLKTISTDNDSAFVIHQRINENYQIPFFFTDPGCPQQKGSVERLNKTIRVYLPKKSKHLDISDERIQWIEDTINNTPMQILGWKTPLEAYREELALNSS